MFVLNVLEDRVMRRNMARPLSLAVAVLIVLPLLVVQFAAPGSRAQAQGGWAPRQITATLKGSGATFPNPLYQSWIQVYKGVVPSVTISYQGVGSGQGIRDFIGYLTDFGGTDAAL